MSPASRQHFRENPRLVIDLKKVSTAYDKLHTLLPEAKIHYAMKCNPVLEILQTVKASGGSFEIASASELMVLESNDLADTTSIIYSNPVKPIEDIIYAYEKGIRRFAFDSRCEIDKLAEYAPGAEVYIRLAALDHESIVDSEGKFGVPGEDAIALMVEAKEKGLIPVGVAFHVGSQMLNPKSWQFAIDQAIQVIEALSHENITLTFLDVGGGFPAQYSGVSEDKLEEITTAIKKGLQELPYPLEIILEPGRYLVADAGVIEATVIGFSERFNKNWLYLNVGALNGLLEALETHNQLQFPMWDSKKSEGTKSYTVTGPTCDSQDTIVYNAILSDDLTVGDKVFIGAAGAYTNTYIGAFNGFEAPEITIAKDK